MDHQNYLNQIIFMRHGIAVDREKFEGDDSERPLTDRGVAKVKVATKGLFKLYQPESIITSHYLRARTTGAICQSELNSAIHDQRNVLETAAISPDSTWEDWTSWVNKMIPNHLLARSIIVVGHEPNLSMILANYLRAPKESFRFKKAGVAIIERQRFDWKLCAVIPPKLWR